MNGRSRKQLVRMLGILLYMCGEIGHLEYRFDEDMNKEVVTVFDEGDEEEFSIYENWDDFFNLTIDVMEEVRRHNKIKSIKVR